MLPKYVAGDLTPLGQADFGTQDGSAGASGSSWYGLDGIARVQLTPTVALAGRLERYDDEDGVIIGTGIPASAFQSEWSVDRNRRGNSAARVVAFRSSWLGQRQSDL